MTHRDGPREGPTPTPVTDGPQVAFTPEHRIKVSFNTQFVDKQPIDRSAFAKGWDPKDATPEELADHVGRGHAFSAQYANGLRRSINFICSGFLAVDIDRGFKLENAVEHPLVVAHGTLLYTTPSHGLNGEDRFRIVFATPEPIDDAGFWHHALLGAARALGGDESATDSARLFFGSQGSTPIILGNMLNAQALAELVQLGRTVEKEQKQEAAERPYKDTSLRAATTIPAAMKIRCADGQELVLEQIPESEAVHCPFHEDERSSAFIVRSRKKKTPGIHCSTCRRTFWREGAEHRPYDFYYFAKLAKKLAQRPGWALNPTEPLLGRESAGPPQLHLLDQKFLPQIPLVDGLIFVKSPKGSGKTKQIRQIIAEARAVKKSVLVIGHRRTLLREMARNLDLVFYLDVDFSWGYRKRKAPNYFAVCLDSVPARLPKRRNYDVVILDESEQVLSHACSRTIKKPVEAIHALQNYLTKAPSLYLLDADLNRITASYVTRCRGSWESQHVRIYLNTHTEGQRSFDVYESRDALVADLLHAVLIGERVFVASNSKRFAKLLSRLLTKEAGTGLRKILITAEEKGEEEVQTFLADIATKILDYDVVIASPAIGTGIDITFPNDGQKIDAVYGFFAARINSHYDCDQQIGRVRNPKKVKVWIDPAEQSYETAPSAVMRDLIESGDAASAVAEFDYRGNPIFDPKHPTLVLKTEVYCAQRASQNRLRTLFLEHKQHGGWLATFVPTVKDAHKALSGRIRDLAKQIAGERVLAISSSRKLMANEYGDLKARQDADEPIGVAATYAVERYEIETFYGVEINPELVTADDEGRLRAAVRLYERLGLDDNMLRDMGRASWAAYKAGEKFGDAFPKPVAGVLLAVLHASGLIGNEGLDLEKKLTKHDLVDFQDLADERALTIERRTSIRLRDDCERDPIGMLNEFLGMIGQRLVLHREFKRDKVKYYEYRLSRPEYDLIAEIVRRRREAESDQG